MAEPEAWEAKHKKGAVSTLKEPANKIQEDHWSDFDV